MDSSLLTARQVAEIFGVNPNTVYQWKRRGLLPFVTMPDSSIVRFPKADVDDLILSRRQEKVVA